MNIREAKTHLARLIEEVEAGVEVVIVKAGKPVARLSRPGGLAKPRKLGLLDGRFRIPDDFNAPLPEGLLAAFEGRRQ